ncbi:MAG TPA: hypothetical protein VNQ73_06740 [Ilumatobacter sp.]|nr:hypothetical protein [Ilumatobacter sp.]
MAWPPVFHEQRPWSPTIDVPRRWQETYSGPYSAAITPPIAELTLDLPAPTAALVAEATAAVAEFDAQLGELVTPFAGSPAVSVGHAAAFRPGRGGQ